MIKLPKMPRKVLFLWFARNTDAGIQNGIAQMSALLKREGHLTSLIVVNNEISYFDILQEIKFFCPDFICFSITAPQRKYAFELAAFIRDNTGVPFIAGGVDVILNTDVYKYTKFFDYLCIGEGEKGLLELVSGKTLVPVNFIRRIKGQIDNWESGKIEPFYYNKNIPAEDYDIFPWYQLMKQRNGWLGEFFIGRGCPHNCTYCSNHAIRNKLFPDNPKDYIRFKNPEKVLWEIQWGIERYNNPKVIVFGDDLFTFNEKYLQEFLILYKKHIALPFVCNARAGTFNDSLAKLLKETGCHQIKFGIEHGNQNIRKDLLNRKESNEVIKKAFNIAKQHGLGTSAFLMIGIPTETCDTIQDTLKLVAQIQPNRYKFSVFYPFPGTKLYDYCEKNDLINWEVYNNLDNYSTISGLKFDNGTAKMIKTVMTDVAKPVNSIIGDLMYSVAHKDYMGVKRSDLAKESKLGV